MCSILRYALASRCRRANTAKKSRNEACADANLENEPLRGDHTNKIMHLSLHSPSRVMGPLNTRESRLFSSLMWSLSSHDDPCYVLRASDLDICYAIIVIKYYAAVISLPVDSLPYHMYRRTLPWLSVGVVLSLVEKNTVNVHVYPVNVLDISYIHDCLSA